ncbi:MAG: hypothetical protein JOZ82_12110 [Marmoricola sp.]|nr:hypothetical protein [Marmoricola sp.]
MSLRTTLRQTLRSLHGNKVGAAIEELHRSENDLALALLRLSDRQKVEHEVFYVARDIAGWSREHVRRLAEAGHDYGLDLDPEAAEVTALMSAVRQRGSELSGRLHEPGLLLLAGLRHVHRMAAGVSLDWEVLAQTAQAMQDVELLTMAKECHPQTLRQLRWANAKTKETAAQIMVTG